MTSVNNAVGRVSVFGVVAAIIFWLLYIALMGRSAMLYGGVYALGYPDAAKYNDVVLETQDEINHIIGSNAQIGDIFEVSFVLEDDPVPNFAMRLYACHGCFTVLYDGQEIYRYGYEFVDRKTFVPQGYHIIPIPENHNGKTLTIRMEAQATNTFASWKAPIFGNVQDVSGFWVTETRLDMVLGIMLILFGFLNMYISVMLYIMYGQGATKIAASIISMVAGLLILTFFNAMFFVTSNLWATTFIEYMCQYLLVFGIFLYLFMMDLKPLMHWFAGICALITILFMVVNITLEALHIVNFEQSLVAYQMVAIPLLIIYMLSIVANAAITKMRKRRRDDVQGQAKRAERTLADRVMVVGVAALMIGAVTQAIGYFVIHGDQLVDLLLTQAFHPLTVGCTIFVISTVLSHFFQDVEATTQSSQERKLVDLASTDALTGLRNRGFCDNTLADFDERKAEYTIFIADINGLKTINDTLGHGVGDKAIKAAAEIIRSQFRARDVVGRFGGDEFMAIVGGMSPKMAQDRISALTDATRKASKRIRAYDLNIAFGAASNSETLNGSAEETFKLADERMYEAKSLQRCGGEAQ